MRKEIEVPQRQGFKAIVAAVLVSLFSLTNAQAQEIKGSAVVSSETVTATVTKINQKTREVTIKTTDGQEHSFVAGDQVKNLAQVNQGDIITVVYTEEIAYQVLEHAKATGVQTTEASARAKPGEQPAAGVARQVTVTVEITAIDPSVPTVTFKGPEGNSRTIKVQDPQKLVGVKVGDMVDITYTQALAIKVDKGPAKK
jgi:ribosomal 50S subunit-recycling heat shock protein